MKVKIDFMWILQQDIGGLIILPFIIVKASYNIFTFLKTTSPIVRLSPISRAANSSPKHKSIKPSNNKQIKCI
jgi:hypothetical protein